MATTKKLTEAEEVEVKEEKKSEAPDPWERVPVFIPRGERNGDPNLYVSVNNYSALLPRGQQSMVPRFIAEEIERSRQAESDYYAYSESREIKPGDKAFS